MSYVCHNTRVNAVETDMLARIENYPYPYWQEVNTNSDRTSSQSMYSTVCTLQCIYTLQYIYQSRPLSLNHVFINYIDTKAKCHLTKFTYKVTLRQVFICLRRPPLLDFCLGWCNSFVGSESCQLQSVKLLSCRIWSPPGLNTPHSLPATHCLYRSVHGRERVLLWQK